MVRTSGLPCRSFDHQIHARRGRAPSSASHWRPSAPHILLPTIGFRGRLASLPTPCSTLPACRVSRRTPIDMRAGCMSSERSERASSSAERNRCEPALRACPEKVARLFHWDMLQRTVRPGRPVCAPGFFIRGGHATRRAEARAAFGRQDSPVGDSSAWGRRQWQRPPLSRPALADASPEAEFVAPHAPFPCDYAPEGRQWFKLAGSRARHRAP